MTQQNTQECFLMIPATEALQKLKSELVSVSFFSENCHIRFNMININQQAHDFKLFSRFFLISSK